LSCWKEYNIVTRGQRRIGRAIRKLENSVELSTKESKAKEAEKKYLEKVQNLEINADDMPVRNLRELFIRQKNFKEH